MPGPRTILAQVLVSLTLVLFASAAWAQSLQPITPEQAGFGPARLGRIADTLRAEIEKVKMPGAVVLIARRGQVGAGGTYFWVDPKEQLVAVLMAQTPVLEPKKDSALINIFLAGSKIRSNERDFPLGSYTINEPLIVVKDQTATESNSKPMLKTMAHEIAHLFNYHRKASTAGHEYYKICGYTSDVLNTLDGTDIKIPHQRVLDWNPW